MLHVCPQELALQSKQSEIRLQKATYSLFIICFYGWVSKALLMVEKKEDKEIIHLLFDSGWAPSLEPCHWQAQIGMCTPQDQPDTLLLDLN